MEVYGNSLIGPISHGMGGEGERYLPGVDQTAVTWATSVILGGQLSLMEGSKCEEGSPNKGRKEA